MNFCPVYSKSQRSRFGFRAFGKYAPRNLSCPDKSIKLSPCFWLSIQLRIGFHFLVLLLLMGCCKWRAPNRPCHLRSSHRWAVGSFRRFCCLQGTELAPQFLRILEGYLDFFFRYHSQLFRCKGRSTYFHLSGNCKWIWFASYVGQ